MALNINTLILNALKDAKLYGLEIIKHIQEETQGELILKQPSLYSALRRLETRGMVSSYWEDSAIGGRRHYYKITKDGLTHLAQLLKTQQAEEKLLQSVAAAQHRQEEVQSANDAKEELSVGEYNPTQRSGNRASFSDVMKKYTKPENDYTEFTLEEKTERSTEQPIPPAAKDTYPTLSADISDDLKNIEIAEEEEEAITQEEEINYRDILGDLLVKEDDSVSEKKEPFTHSGQRPDPRKQTAEESRKYAREIQSILGGKKEGQAQSSPLVSPTISGTLEEISRRYAKKPVSSLETEIDGKDIEIKTYQSFAPVEKKVTHSYLLINRIQIFSALFISLFMLLEIAGLFTYFILNDLIGLEQWIFFGGALAITLLFLAIKFLQYKRYPDKKVRPNQNWGLKFLYRLLVVVLLIIFVFAINLALGMTDPFDTEVLLRWLLPSVMILNIVLVLPLQIIAGKSRKNIV